MSLLTSSSAGGKVTFGGKDMQNCKDNWIKLLSTKVEWTLPVARY